MRDLRLSKSTGALASAVVCIAILAGMMVGHAWPLWTGQDVLLRVRPIDPRDLFRGEFVRLDVPATRLRLAGTAATAVDATIVRPLGAWAKPDPMSDRSISSQGRIVYVQLERPAGSAEHQPVSLSDTPIANAVNLRGRIRWTHEGLVHLDFGLDAFYMREGRAKPVEDALREGRLVQIQVAIAPSGRARIRDLFVDSVPAR